MASPFAKYQSEQVNQLAPGFVEAYGRAGASIGQGLASAGQSIAQGMEKADQRKQEEAKIQGMLSPYLKTDQRVQSVKQQLASGWMKLDDNGNVYIPDEHKDKFDPAKAADAISFYNETGGDGSKLTGPALTKFATSFEAEKKYAAEQAALEDKRIEKLKTLAEIRKMEAEAAEKYGKLGRSEIIGAFGGGADMASFTPSVAQPSFRSVLEGTPYETGGAGLANRGNKTLSAPESPSILSTTSPVGIFNTDLSGKGFSLTPGGEAPFGFSPERYQAGAPVATALKTATPSPTISTTAPAVPGAEQPVTRAGTPVKPAPAPSAVTAPMPLQTTTTGASMAYVTEIPKLQAARTALDTAWQKEASALSTNFSLAMARLTAAGGSADDIKALNETFKSQYDLKVQRYNANVASIADRLAGFEKTASETRAAQTANLQLTAEDRAKAEAQRAKDKAEMTKVEFEAKYGVANTTGAATVTKAKTFAEAVASRVEQGIPGRTGGTEVAAIQKAAAEKHETIMKGHPAWWNLGLSTEGAKQYQFELRNYPSAKAIDSSVISNVEESVAGYNEGRVFLTQLLSAVNSTDENAVRNYLDRMLLFTSKDVTQAQGELLSQFGVAAFRKAIVSGGNFSDQDRIYVEKIITQINSLNPAKDKDKMLAQTKVLAEFIDSRFRAGLSSKGVRVDLDTAEKFLKREKDEIGLSELAKAREFYTAYKIDPKAKTTISNNANALDIPALRQKAAAARDAGNEALAKRLEEEASKLQKAKEAAAKKAAADAAKTR